MSSLLMTCTVGIWLGSVRFAFSCVLSGMCPGTTRLKPQGGQGGAWVCFAVLSFHGNGGTDAMVIPLPMAGADAPSFEATDVSVGHRRDQRGRLS
jgi:hypothetical protein